MSKLQALNFHKIGNLDRAKEIYLNIIKENPLDFDTYRLLGVLEFQKKNFHESLILIKKSLSINNKQPFAYSNLGNTLQELKNFKEAIESYKQAITLKSNYDEAFNNLGLLYTKIGMHHEAITCFEKSIFLNNKNSFYFSNLAKVQKKINLFDKAISNFEHAKSISIDEKYLMGELIFTKLESCSWDNFSKIKKEVKLLIKKEKIFISPLISLALYDNVDLHLKNAKNFYRTEFFVKKNDNIIIKNLNNKKIRVGYFSADFYNHATSYLIAEMFENHNKDEFEIFGFSYIRATHDEMSERLSKSFNKFFYLHNKTNEEIVRIARDLKLDIAVDLQGYTVDSRSGIFSERVAPIQINFLGYPGTLGSDCHDYIIADKVVIPKSNVKFFTEKIVYMPNTYQPFDSNYKISKNIFLKKEFGLPNGSFVFCCFNNTFKILPDIFDVWMSILKSVPSSVLWLYCKNDIVQVNLKKEAKLKGVDENRIIFAQFLQREEHLLRYKFADLFIDTFPYGAHTTARDALEMNLPVLTLKGNSFASLVASSLINALELPDLIANSKEEYKDIAIELSTNREKLQSIKEKIVINKSKKAFSDNKIFTKAIEKAYVQMVDSINSGKKLLNIEL